MTSFLSFPFNLLILALYLLFSSPLQAQNEILAVIDGQKVIWEDIEDKRINDLRKELYGAVLEKIKVYSITKLAEKDNNFQKKPKLSVPEDLMRELYTANNLSSRGTFEEFKPVLEEYYQKKIKAAFQEQLFQKGLRSGKIKLKIEKPKNYKVKIDIGKSVLRGNKKARVMVLEFSDYQCPFCGKVQPAVKALQKKYGARVVFSYKHLPLAFHKEAKPAANAVECAREQGKFEVYHQYLFTVKDHLRDNDLKKYARKFKIRNLQQFDQCVDSKKYFQQVAGDLEQAKQLSINGTPTFIIGRYDSATNTLEGEVASGALPKEAFIKLINPYL